MTVPSPSPHPLGLSRLQWESLARSWSLPAYRGRQIFDAIHRRGARSAAEIHEVPRELRELLNRETPIGLPSVVRREASRDGSVIVGWSLTNGGSTSDHAFWWTAKTGLRDLKTELQSRGVTGLDNWLLYAATGVSDDGSVIVGVALNLVTHEWQPFRAVLPVVTSTPSPTPTATSSRTPTPTPRGTATPGPSGSATPTATPSRSPRR